MRESIFVTPSYTCTQHKIEVLCSTVLSSMTSRTPKDCFKGLRTTYNSVLKAVASNNIVAMIISGSPFYYMLGYGIYYSRVAGGQPLLLSANWGFMTILVLAWIIASVSIWKIMPNLLTFSIFVYTSIGHWCLISLFVFLCYLMYYTPIGSTASLLSALMPPILLLLLSGDVLRSVRTRLYALIDGSKPAADISTVDTTVIAV